MLLATENLREKLLNRLNESQNELLDLWKQVYAIQQPIDEDSYLGTVLSQKFETRTHQESSVMGFKLLT